MSQKFTCAACGFAQDERTKSDAADRWLCPICTNTGVEGPDFETIVYEKAIAILNNRPNQEPQEALKEAYTFVAQLPYWQRKDLPSLPPTGLRTVQKTLLLSVNMGRLEVGREIIRPPDFFISHKQKEEPDRELVEPLVTGLKERGYHVWYDEDTWGTEAGKVTAWMERGIDQARHCITVLCQDYFASEVCIYELNYMLMKKAKFVFPIWWTDIDENFIEQKKRGIKLPDLPEIIIEWKDCKENMDILVEKLIEHVNAAEGLQDYNGVSLVADEVRMLKQLETSIDEVIPPLKQQELSSATFGFYAEKNRINALFLEEKGLQKLPKSLRQCVKLKWLHLRKNHNLFNGYVEIPTYLSTLQTLNLESNQLTSLPETIEHLTNLQELYLNNNLLVSLPETIGNLTKLETLQLQENKLTSLPASIGNLKSLQTLNLYNNQLASLPASIGNLQSLQNLELWRNKLTSLPASFGQLTQLVELNLGLNRLGSLPETIGNLTKLETLQLQENKLTSLPESVGNLTNLHVFNLWHNLLESLPKSFGNLTNLRTLYLWWNQLSSLPASFGQLTQLVELNLGLNNFASLPETLFQLTNLQNLNLSWNKFISLPENLKWSSKLTELDLSYNGLAFLPETIGQLTNLQTLNLRSNKLASLPKTLKQLIQLTYLDLRGNPDLGDNVRVYSTYETVQAYLTTL